MISKHIFLITFFNESELSFFLPLNGFTHSPMTKQFYFKQFSLACVHGLVRFEP